MLNVQTELMIYKLSEEKLEKKVRNTWRSYQILSSHSREKDKKEFNCCKEMKISHT